MNHKHYETFYLTCSLKQIIRGISTSEQPVQRLWKVNTFSIFIQFFWKFRNSKKKQRMVAGATKLAHLVHLIAWFCMSHQ